MKKVLFASLMLVAVTAWGAVFTYGFEDGGLPLGYYGNGEPPIIAEVVGAPDPVHSGDYSLRCIDNASSSTPQAYLIWVQGLQDGDSVFASFFRYDTTPGAAPSCRIWANWNDNPDDITGYNGSASGQSDYGPGEGWDEANKTWSVSGHTGIVIHVRTYSSAGDTVWVDDITVDAPDHATVILPEGDTATENATWSSLKAIF
ncbi:MAG: hypothetical protein QF492_06835 [Candidatus Krumholzibacteria bacterium]|jgi:hypothetical protein|nr:hypothetical protein [Candidatus Krumholzibacteria bacterium]MDP6669599.1 hypothetical protein [Candidatus Krumholzibacteria bacterium]MDP6798149.1 hypothetical protein [Candidatus Krumholzibacteria bacterium]MDP7022004.1 hypothetical protein [Candidatus Krumholzibacteria bacterium]